MTAHFEILEHASDVGLRLSGDTLEEVFQAAGEGFATLQGAWFAGVGEQRKVEVRAVDNAGLLAAWIDELLYLQHEEDAAFGGFDVQRVSEGALEAMVRVNPKAERELDALEVKAASHQGLRLERGSAGWTADVYLDV